MLYPEVLTSDNKLAIAYQDIGSYYQLTISPNQRFKIKNVMISTSNRNDTTFMIPKSINKTYHLRYSLNGKPINNYYPKKNTFYIVDVNDTRYNPSSLPEFYDVFDTTVDDMLIAKIEVTSSGITILNLRYNIDMRFYLELYSVTSLRIPFDYRWRLVQIRYWLENTSSDAFTLTNVIASGASYFKPIGSTTILHESIPYLDSAPNPGQGVSLITISHDPSSHKALFMVKATEHPYGDHYLFSRPVKILSLDDYTNGILIKSTNNTNQDIRLSLEVLK